MPKENPDEELNHLIEENEHEDYSYLDDEDVYEEYFIPNGEIEIDEDEEVEFVEAILPPPPPPSPFPPFRGFQPPRLPPFVVPPIQEIEIEEVETEEIEMEYVEEEDVLLSTQQSTPSDDNTIAHHQTYAQMNSAEANVLANVGVEQSELIRRENSLSQLRSFFKVIVGLLVFAGLCGLCYIFILWNHSLISQKNEMDMAEYQRKNIGWRLPESISNNIIKRFFETLGSISSVSKLTDMLLKGNIEMNGKKEDFYCIRRANGATYIKIGANEKGERAYFVGSGSEGVFKLIDLRTAGRKSVLKGKEAIVLQSLLFFDEQMFKLAFITDMRTIGENVESFKFLGRRIIDSIEVDILQSNRDNINFTYAFSSKTGQLHSTNIISSDGEVMIKYADYKPDDSGIKIPFSREIYLNGKLVAKVDSRIIIRNKGFIFP